MIKIYLIGMLAIGIIIFFVFSSRDTYYKGYDDGIIYECKYTETCTAPITGKRDATYVIQGMLNAIGTKEKGGTIFFRSSVYLTKGYLDGSLSHKFSSTNLYDCKGGDCFKPGDKPEDCWIGRNK